MGNIAVNIAILSRKRYHDHKYLSHKRYLEAFSKVSLNRVFLKIKYLQFCVLMQVVRIQHYKKRYHSDKGHIFKGIGLQRVSLISEEGGWRD